MNTCVRAATLDVPGNSIPNRGSDLIVENVAKTKIESVYQSVIHVMINFNLYGRHRMFQRMALPIKKP